MKNFTFDEIRENCKKIVKYIQVTSDVKKVNLIGVARGGLVPAVIISHMLDIKNIQIAKISSYSDETLKKTEFEDYTTDLIIDSENNFFIEDVVDSGKTVEYLKKKYPKSKFVSLTVKRETTFVYSPTFVDSKEWIVFPWE